MRGTKRLAISDSNPDSSDAIYWNKRIMEGSPFGLHRPEVAQPRLMPAAPLDLQRAESSRQHVRALNFQFASWVQNQLQSHPDELWEDGVQDYLSHASNIMEKFNDVVNWLKENAVKEENPPEVAPCANQKKTTPSVNGKEVKSVPEKQNYAPSSSPSFMNSSTSASVGMSANFQTSGSFGLTAKSANLATSWSSGVVSNSQSPFLFGGQPSVTTSSDIHVDGDGETEMEQPSSPSVKKTEEKGIVVIHEVKCKLYVKSSDPTDTETWKNKGMGHLYIKCREGISKGAKESKPTIIIRDDVGRIQLNALLYPGIKTSLQKNSLVAIFHILRDDAVKEGANDNHVVARTFLIKTKNEEERNRLAAAIQEYAPAA